MVQNLFYFMGVLLRLHVTQDSPKEIDFIPTSWNLHLLEKAVLQGTAINIQHTQPHVHANQAPEVGKYFDLSDLSPTLGNPPCLPFHNHGNVQLKAISLIWGPGAKEK